MANTRATRTQKAIPGQGHILRTRGPGPGVVRAAFASVREKVDVLRGKHYLKSNTQFAKVCPFSKVSHQIMESNFKTLLLDLLAGKDFYISGNGRLIKRDSMEAAAGATGERRSAAARRR